ncbi:MAG: alpha/beta fold hydrolase [Promethearchaeia archaeon]
MKEFKISTRAGTVLHGKLHTFPAKNESQKAPALNVILVHAFPFDSDMYLKDFKDKKFFKKLNTLARNKGKFRIFIPDLPGFGKSEPFSSPPQDLVPYVEIIQDLVLEFRIERLFLGGCSMGGYITLEYGKQFPDNLNGMILIDTRPTADTPEQKQNRLDTIENFEKILGNSDESVKVRLNLGDFYSKYSAVKNFVDSLYAKVTSEGLQKEKPKKGEKIKDFMKNQSILGVIHALKGMAGRSDNSSFLKEFQGNTLILVGEKDGITPIEIAQEMDQLAKHSTLQIIPNAGHLSNWEQPSRFNESFLNWFSNL